MRLNDAQVNHFKVFGFVVLRQFFSQDELGGLDSEFEEVLASDRQGESFDGAKRHTVQGFVEKRPLLTEYLEQRICEPIQQLLGADCVWMGSDANLYVGDTGWHPDAWWPDLHVDGSQMELARIKISFYLDSLDKDNGCLRVIPGSHRSPLYDAVKPLRAQKNDTAVDPFGALPHDVPAFPIETRPGDALVMDQNIWHSSFGGRPGRRSFTINFAENPTSPEQMAYFEAIHQFNLDYIRQAQHTQSAQVYEDSFLAIRTPRIGGMVSRLVEMGLR